MDAPNPRSTLTAALPTAPDGVQYAFAMLGARSPSEVDPSATVRARDRVREFVRGRAWDAPLREGAVRAASVIGAVPRTSVTALVGMGWSDASGGYWRGEGRAFIWLENWLGHGATGSLQDRDLADLPLSVAHELAHAFRPVLPSTESMEPSRIDRLDSVWEVRDVRRGMPLAEVMFEEGLAVAFSLAAYPDADVTRALIMRDDAVEWLDRHWAVLLRDRMARVDLWAHDPDPSWLADAAYGDPSRRPPWSVVNPPPRWGYYVGMRWAQGALTGDWRHDLGQATPPRTGPEYA